MNFWTEISDRLKSREGSPYTGKASYPKVNAHIHTPWSYSSFDSIDSTISQAKKENIQVLGINDFNTVAGYPEWAEKCFNNNIFPLFNIEMIGLDHEAFKAGRKVNDPGNPGRTYISGKGLAFPVRMSEQSSACLERIRKLSNHHVLQMTDRVNRLLAEIDPGLVIDFGLMLRDHTMGMVRERHLAGRVRSTILERYSDSVLRDSVFTNLLGDDFLKLNIEDYAVLENLIRSKLLKAGGPAFVEEDPDIFIDPEDIRDLVLDAGGIPTYPFLADFGSGRYTDFERDLDDAAAKLIERGFFSVEFIPGRNDSDRLKEYVKHLYNHGFIVTFGTEHNAPGIAPVEVSASGRQILDDDLLRINFEGASIIAAHQFKSWQDGEGYLSAKGVPKLKEKEDFIRLGGSVINSVCNKS